MEPAARASRTRSELKEAYLDLEMFDSRLWLRVGKQNIVWGKTELFRTTDQFNPQDLALATLPEPRGVAHRALGGARASGRSTRSGRSKTCALELAAEPRPDRADRPRPLRRALHAEPRLRQDGGALRARLAGSALAGEIRPPDPWDDAAGLEFGARVEFRWDRFSFALSDFYGYDDFPYVDPVF